MMESNAYIPKLQQPGLINQKEKIRKFKHPNFVKLSISDKRIFGK